MRLEYHLDGTLLTSGERTGTSGTWYHSTPNTRRSTSLPGPLDVGQGLEPTRAGAPASAVYR